jgi:hypothetical protein
VKRDRKTYYLDFREERERWHWQVGVKEQRDGKKQCMLTVDLYSLTSTKMMHNVWHVTGKASYPSWFLAKSRQIQGTQHMLDLPIVSSALHFTTHAQPPFHTSMDQPLLLSSRKLQFSPIQSMWPTWITSFLWTCLWLNSLATGSITTLLPVPSVGRYRPHNTVPLSNDHS